MTAVILEQLKQEADRDYTERRLEHWKGEYPHLDVFVGSWKGKAAIVGTDEPC